MSRKLFALGLCLSFLMSGLLPGLRAQQPTPSPTPAPEAAKTQEERKQAEQKDKKEEKWDVEADHGPTTTVEFDTDEGTWMSCDVSPDGQRIVFDLLGDIYQMPISGGPAQLLAGGRRQIVQVHLVALRQYDGRNLGAERARQQAAQLAGIVGDERALVRAGDTLWLTVPRRSDNSYDGTFFDLTVTGVGTEPAYAIGQRLLLVETPEGDLVERYAEHGGTGRDPQVNAVEYLGTAVAGPQARHLVVYEVHRDGHPATLGLIGDQTHGRADQRGLASTIRANYA